MDFFTDGFSLQNFNQKFQHLPLDEKAQILQNVIEALNLDLKLYSSADRHEKYLTMKKNQEEVLKKLNPPTPAQSMTQRRLAQEKVDSPSRVEFQRCGDPWHRPKKSVPVINMNGKTRVQELIDNDLNRVTHYNPYLSPLAPVVLKRKYRVPASISIASKKAEHPLFVGGQLLRKLGVHEAKKERERGLRE